jgi:hypothetical protein
MKALKHLCFIGIVVLFASAMVSCDFVEKPDVPDNIVGYTEDGRPLISLTIATPGRALTLSQAQTKIDYYEVVFYDNTVTPGKHYRAVWPFTKRGRINIPPVNYANNAVLFAGRNSDKTLLAVGVIAPGSANVSTATVTIDFNMTALTTDVTATPASSFQIMTPGYLTSALTTATFPKERVDGVDYPVYKIPEDDPVDARLTVGGILPASRIMVAEPGGRIWVSGEVTDSRAFVGTPTLSGGTITPAAAAALPDGIINITGLTATGGMGFVKMAIEIPVFAISADNDAYGRAPITWYIRGGLQNEYLDLGATANSQGGTILLGVGNVTGYQINPIGPPSP